jgi:hypothetical protein
MVDYRKIVVFCIALIHSVVISFFLATEDLDARYLTYVNYMLMTAFFIFLLYCSKSDDALRLVLLTLYPIVFNIAFFIGVAIIAIVQLNDWVFTRTTVVHSGPRRVGDVHTGDWILHQLPVVAMFVVFVMYIEDARKGYRELRRCFNSFGTAIYYAFIVSFPSLVILLYFATEDTAQNYPTETIAGWVKLVLSLVASNLVGGFFLLLLNPCGKVSK